MIIDELMSAADASTNQTSVQKDLGDMTNFCAQVTFSSGTLNGSLKLQGSVDGVTYGDIDNSTKAVTSGGAVTYSVVDAIYRYFRVVWTRTSGTGTITVKSVVKEPVIKGA